MITVDTIKSVLDGYSTSCPKGHFLSNLKDNVDLCAHCGVEVVVVCPECKKAGHPAQWPAPEVIRILAIKEVIDFQGAQKHGVN